MRPSALALPAASAGVAIAILLLASFTVASAPPPTSGREVAHALTGSKNTYVILVHGFDPAIDPASVWTYGVDIDAQLVKAGYTVGIVSYYGEFTLVFSNGLTYRDPSFFGTTNTPIQEIGQELAKAVIHLFGTRGATLDLVGHSMGGLVVKYMLETSVGLRVHVKNVIYLGSPMNGAPLTALSGYVNTSGYQAVQMEQGNAFLTTLLADQGNITHDYPGAVQLVYSGDADPYWASAFFSGQPNDGLVEVASTLNTAYAYSFLFPNLHIPELDVDTPGYVSYFENPAVPSEMVANFNGHY